MVGFESISNSNQLRQSRIGNYRDARAVRNMVRWFLPETGIVEMYVNPQSIKYSDNKHIDTPKRTRGGYLVQYWGEQIGKLSISGTTGSSGVEGINVLYDVYRNEQIALDALAVALDAAREKSDSPLNDNDILGAIGKIATAGVDSIFDQVNNVIENGNIDPAVSKPTLASLAFQVEMYWSGWVYRGFFNSMSVDEAANNLGLFDYSIDFSVVQKRGARLNFMPWHRSALNGPSNSDPRFGTPYSFGNLIDPVNGRTLNGQTLDITRKFKTLAIDTALQSGRPIL
jgi:hypothetical protein